MKSRTSELAVGIFCYYLRYCFILFSNESEWFSGLNLSDGYTMKAQFDNVNGLKPRAKSDDERCNNWPR